MQKFIPAAIAALSFGVVWAAGTWGLEGLIRPPAPSSLPSSVAPQVDPSRSMPGTPLRDPAGGNWPATRSEPDGIRGDDDSATASCEGRGRARATCLRQDRIEPQKPGGTYPPANHQGTPHQFASLRSTTAPDFS